MERRAIWRVWYGKRLGIPQSFEDIGSFNGAVSFAAYIMADRIEVVRETDVLPTAGIVASQHDRASQSCSRIPDLPRRR